MSNTTARDRLIGASTPAFLRHNRGSKTTQMVKLRCRTKKHLKDGRTAVRRIKAMNRSANPCSKEAANALARFVGLPRTEGAFYLEFQRLAPSEALALRHFWGIDHEWRLFARICRFFGF